MKNILALVLIIGFGSVAFSDSFTLRHDQSGQVFHCGTDTGSGGSSSSGAACVSRVTKVCNDNTGMGGNVCFSKATDVCKGASHDFAICVESTVKTCVDNTGMGGNVCFSKALDSCKGSAAAIKELIQGAQDKMRADLK